jgi:photosystem II stability/assembly factor-like uncharacterized protein
LLLLLRILAIFLSFLNFQCLAAGTAFQDPLDEAALSSPQSLKGSLFSVGRAGERIVAVGVRGVILYSDSSGNEWQQAKVPVSADLTGLSFPSAREGWVVGHGAVVLHSADGGATWVKQIDGRNLGPLTLQYYESAAGTLAADLGADRAKAILAQAQKVAEEKETIPLMDVWFKNEKTGYVAGLFNRLFRTDDGGAHWIPLLDKTDNPGELHFYAIRGLGNEIFIAGEQGSVWRWDETKGRFISVKTPYSGSLFGLVLTPRVVLAFGMRGSLFRTLDRGAHWEKIPSGLSCGIVAGDIRANGEIVLACQSGDLIVSSDEGATFKPLVLSRHTAIAASVVSAPNGGFVLVGPAGVRAESPIPANPNR